jgi:hypothetical protein
MKPRLLPLAVLVLAGLLVAGTVQAQTSPGHDLSWHVIASGGREDMSSGAHSIDNTLGQTTIGLTASSASELEVGYWHGLGAEILAYVFLPNVPRAALVAPDLVVESLTATSTNVTMVLRNQGNGPVVDEFWVDVYVNPAIAPSHVNQLWSDLGTQGLAWGVTAPALPIAPGSAVTLNLNDAYFWPSYSYVAWPIPAGTPVYAQADSYNQATTYGAVLEDHEITGGPYNNILGPVFSVPGAAGVPLPVMGADPPASPGLPARR